MSERKKILFEIIFLKAIQRFVDVKEKELLSKRLL